MIPNWELSIALDAIGVSEPAQQQAVIDAIPIADKLINHIKDNMALFETLSADIKILIPAAKIVLDALKTSTGG